MKSHPTAVAGLFATGDTSIFRTAPNEVGLAHVLEDAAPLDI